MRPLGDIMVGAADRPAAPRKSRKTKAPPRAAAAMPVAMKGKIGAALALGLVLAAAWGWRAGAVRATAAESLSLSRRVGFEVASVAVSGRVRTPREQIDQAVNVAPGDAIFGVGLVAMRARLEALPTVKAAAVERRLPGRLIVTIVERQPVALWQRDGRFVLIDGEGHAIPGPIEGFEDLLLVVGEGAAAEFGDLQEMLAAQPVIAARVKSAVRVGGRRWDLRLDDPARGLEARLPEEGAAAAYARLAALEGGQGLSSKHVVMVDLRQSDRLVLKTAQGGGG